MTRLETLEKVLVAAQTVLDAREDQMLTHVEWDALATAIADARPDKPVAINQPVRIVFEDDLMMVMDDQNLGYDCLDLSDCALEEADAQIDRWAAQYRFDVDIAKRDLAEYYPEQ